MSEALINLIKEKPETLYYESAVGHTVYVKKAGKKFKCWIGGCAFAEADDFDSAVELCSIALMNKAKEAYEEAVNILVASKNFLNKQESTTRGTGYYRQGKSSIFIKLNDSNDL